MQKLAHDVAQFVTIIWGQCELIERLAVKGGLAIPDALLLRVRDIRQAAKDIDGTVRDAAQRGTVPVLKAGLNLNQVVEELAYLSVLRNRVTVKLELAKDLPPLPVWTPSTTLHRALMNLCSNAKHAMESAAGEAAVFDSSGENAGVPTAPAPLCGVLTIRTALSEDGLCVSVADTGPGMSEPVQTRLLERMRGGAESIHDGHGHGLQIVYAFAEMMGGEVFLESAPGQGTKFTITLPLTRGTVAA